MSAISKSPLAELAARELGVACLKLKDGSYKIGNSYGGGNATQAEVDETIAALEASGAKPLSDSQRAAYDSLQSEGYGRDFE